MDLEPHLACEVFGTILQDDWPTLDRTNGTFSISVGFISGVRLGKGATREGLERGVS